jgi:flavin reductase (DIM6/NTAB) family NADH-FMN oxidoreductase RutF/rubredoxin
MNRKAFRTISYGIYIVTSRKGDKINGQTADTVFQITPAPRTVAVSINRQNLTHEYISYSGVFGVSVLAKDAPLNLVGTFGFKSGRDTDKFSGVNYKLGETNVPIILDNTLAYLEAKVIDRVELSTHTLFIGEAVAAEIIKEGEPMTYTYYHQIKGGTTPKTAPTYIEDEKREEKKMEGLPKYRCEVCGYIYDPEKGDPDGDIPPGTPFEDLPDDWICPICGAGKGDFEKVD